MSAVLSNPTPLSTARWLDTATAAARMRVSTRRIAQLCAEKWAALGLARRDGASGGGGGKWEVREDADPQLARVLTPDAMPFDWGSLTADQRRELQQREAIVKGWCDARESGLRDTAPGAASVEEITAAYCQRVSEENKSELTPDTLYRWHRSWRDEGVAGLVDGRWKKRAEAEADAFLLEARRWYLMKGKTFSKRDCWLMATGEADRRSWLKRSYESVKRYLARIPRATAVLQREGGEAYTNECEPFAERDYSTINSNDWWNADHHIFDVIVTGPNGRPCRPWLTAWQDVRSRRIVGHVLRCADPNADTIIEAWRTAVLAHGVPSKVLMDNGRDFKSRAFAGRSRSVRIDNGVPVVTSILERLGVEKVLAKPYHPQSKPIERFFRTLEEGFGAWWATYTSGSPDTKPEILADNLAAGKAPTLAEFSSAFNRWLGAGYNQKPHFGDGMGGKTPDQVFEMCLVEKRTTTREALDVLCLKPTKPVRVTQNGVRDGGIVYFDSDLIARHLGKMVTLRIDARDINSGVQVYEADTDRFICIAKPRKRLPWGATAQEIREAHADKSKVRRKVREYAEEVRPRAHEDIVDTMLRARASLAEQNAAQAPAPDDDNPMVIRPVRSSIDDQLPAIQRAKQLTQLKPAAGGESITAADVAAAFARKPSARPATDSFMELESVFTRHGRHSGEVFDEQTE